MEATSENIKVGIKSTLVGVLNLPIDPSQIDDEVVLFDGRLGLDSVAAIEILTGIEEFFEIEFEDEQIGLHLFESVNALAAAVEYQLAKRRPGAARDGVVPAGPVDSPAMGTSAADRRGPAGL